MNKETPEQKHWYACRVFHQQMKALKVQLENEEIQFFVPMRLVQEEKEDGYFYREEVVIPSLIFICTTENDLRNLRQRYVSHLSVYYTPGTNCYAEIPNREMDIFMDVLSKGCKRLEVIDEQYVKGSHVRITGGLLKGSVGYIVRVHGTKRFVVKIDGITAVATTFIPKEFIEKI